VDGATLGNIGLSTAVLGGLGIFAAQRALERAYAGLDPALAAAADRSLGRLRYATWVIAAAVGGYLVARRFGHGRLGLEVAVAALMANATVAAWLRVRWTRMLEPGVELLRRVVLAAYAQMFAAWLSFAGSAVYLLRD
jgi:hypothetical protein